MTNWLDRNLYKLKLSIGIGGVEHDGYCSATENEIQVDQDITLIIDIPSFIYDHNVTGDGKLKLDKVMRELLDEYVIDNIKFENGHHCDCTRYEVEKAKFILAS